MRIIAGRWRGRVFAAPASLETRPTADRVRQALFDMLWHAAWAGRGVIEGAHVLDAFAGSGALGLEALSRGAASAVFIEQNQQAVLALRRTIASLGATAEVLRANVLAPPPARAPASLVFLDPPYAKGLIDLALAGLRGAGFLTPDALVVAETSRAEPPPHRAPLAERMHGAARLSAWRLS